MDKDKGNSRKTTAKIKYKVFKERDIKELMELFLLAEHDSGENHSRLEFVIDYKDGNSDSDFEALVIDETKMIKSINFSFYDFTSGDGLEVFINDSFLNYEVESIKKDWLLAKSGRIKEILEAVQKQNYYLSNFSSQLLITNLFGLTLGVTLFFTVTKNIVLGDDGLLLLLLINLVLVAIGQVISFALFYGLLFKFYPEIEFDTSLDHINKNKKAKGFILALFITFIVPVGIAFIFN